MRYGKERRSQNAWDESKMKPKVGLRPEELVKVLLWWGWLEVERNKVRILRPWVFH
jgi:hypothetical protein